MNTELIIMTSSAHVAGKARKFGRYRNVAVVEVETGKRPAMISTRARGALNRRPRRSPGRDGNGARLRRRRGGVMLARASP